MREYSIRQQQGNWLLQAVTRFTSCYYYSGFTNDIRTYTTVHYMRRRRRRSVSVSQSTFLLLMKKTSFPFSMQFLHRVHFLIMQGLVSLTRTVGSMNDVAVHPTREMMTDAHPYLSHHKLIRVRLRAFNCACSQQTGKRAACLRPPQPTN